MAKKKIKNEKEYPKAYYCRHMFQGVVSYPEEGIQVLVRNDVMKKMSPSFEGRPVVVMHQEIDRENLKDQMDGVVVNCFYNEHDGWFWSKFMAITDDAHEAIRKGWRVSNCYDVLNMGEGGTFLNVPYDKEVLEGSFDHLAIVENPRYEDAIIMTPEEFSAYNSKKVLENNKIKNSKGNKGKVMLNIFKKTKVEKDLDAENSFITLENGTDVSVQTMINEMEEKAKKEEEEKENKKKNEDKDLTVKVNGEEMKVSELKEKYEQMTKNKKNESEDLDEEEKEKKANEDAEAKKKEEEDAKKENAEKEAEKKANALATEKEKKQFEKFKNEMAKAGKETPVKIETSETKVARGKEKY